MDERERLILPYIKGKKILDLGCGDTRDRFLHNFISKNSSYVLGVEIDEERAKKLRDKGFNVIVGNAETLDLNQCFDVIVAGDLIEHLNNPGLFLESIKKHLKQNGIIIINTPNIYSINLLLRGLIKLGNVKMFPEHTMGFNEYLLIELLRRHKIKVIKIIYFSHKEKTLKSIIIRFLSFFSKKWHENIMVICKK